MIGDVAEVLMGQSPPGKTCNKNGEGLPFLQGSAEFGAHFPSPVRYCSAPTRVVEVGNLLISVRAPVGGTNFADQRLAIGRGLAAIRSSERATNQFIRLAMQSETERLNRSTAGGVFAGITAKNLRGFSIMLPPVVEQERIVKLATGLVGGVDEMLQVTEATLDSTRSMREGVLSELLSGAREIPDSYDALLESV